MEWNGGGEWDNCNSIINKYIFKKNKKINISSGEGKKKLKRYKNNNDSKSILLYKLRMEFRIQTGLFHF